MTLLRDINFYALVVSIVSVAKQFIPGRGPGLNYIVNARRSLVSMRDEFAGKIEVRYEGIRVGALHMVEFALINTGGKAIRSADFEHPLSIQLPISSRLMDVALDEGYPDSVGARYSYSLRRIRIEPLLLNPGESVALRVLATELRTPWQFHVRIAGISPPMEMLSDPRVHRDTRRVITWSLVGCAVVLGLNLALRLGGHSVDWVDRASVVAWIMVVGLSVRLVLLRPGVERRLYRGRTGLLEPVRTMDSSGDSGPPSDILMIHSAVYGIGESYIDVTETLRERVSRGRLDVVADNSTAGSDPAPNRPKELRVDFTVGPERLTRVVPEGSRVTLP